LKDKKKRKGVLKNREAFDIRKGKTTLFDTTGEKIAFEHSEKKLRRVMEMHKEVRRNS